MHCTRHCNGWISQWNTPYYDDVAPATQHQELMDLEQQSVKSHSFAYFNPVRPDYQRNYVIAPAFHVSTEPFQNSVDIVADRLSDGN